MYVQNKNFQIQYIRKCTQFFNPIKTRIKWHVTQKDLYTDGTLCIFSWNIYCLSVVDRNSKLHSNVYKAMILYLNVIQVAYNLLSGWNVHCWSNIILFPSSISLFSSISCRFTATCHVFYSDIYVWLSILDCPFGFL
jgi:hypothetical protein